MHASDLKPREISRQNTELYLTTHVHQLPVRGIAEAFTAALSVGPSPSLLYAAMYSSKSTT